MNQLSETPVTFTAQQMLIAKRGAFYEGAQYLYNEHFTTVHPFPAREVIIAVEKRFPSKELRQVAINGNQYRVNDKVIEILTGPTNRREWTPAQAITPEAVLTLADLIRNPYKKVSR
jgi:hypothetical protein